VVSTAGVVPQTRMGVGVLILFTAPNNALEPTASSVRSCVAPASVGGSPLAFGVNKR
jgi:hypothetical protein